MVIFKVIFKDDHVTHDFAAFQMTSWSLLTKFHQKACSWDILKIVATLIRIKAKTQQWIQKDYIFNI